MDTLPHDREERAKRARYFTQQQQLDNMKTIFPDTIELSNLETAAAINTTLHHLRRKKLSPNQATLVEMLCNYLSHEREQLIHSAVGTILNRNKTCDTDAPSAENL